MNHVQVRAAAIKEHGRLSTLNNPPGQETTKSRCDCKARKRKTRLGLEQKNKNSREHCEHVNCRIQ